MAADGSKNPTIGGCLDAPTTARIIGEMVDTLKRDKSMTWREFQTLLGGKLVKAGEDAFAKFPDNEMLVQWKTYWKDSSKMSQPVLQL